MKLWKKAAIKGGGGGGVRREGRKGGGTWAMYVVCLYENVLM